MDCTETIELLGEYQAGTLEEPVHVRLYSHVVECQPCKELHDDYGSIVSAALLLRACDDDGNCPDPEVIWQRMKVVAPGNV